MSSYVLLLSLKPNFLQSLRALFDSKAPDRQERCGVKFVKRLPVFDSQVFCRFFPLETAFVGTCIYGKQMFSMNKKGKSTRTRKK